MKYYMKKIGSCFWWAVCLDFTNWLKFNLYFLTYPVGCKMAVKQLEKCKCIAQSSLPLCCHYLAFIGKWISYRAEDNDALSLSTEILEYGTGINYYYCFPQQHREQNGFLWWEERIGRNRWPLPHLLWMEMPFHWRNWAIRYMPVN